MKYLLLLFCLLYFSPLETPAQHCPFDGGYLIVIHLTDRTGKPIVDAANNLSLAEINNPKPQSCTYAEGLLKINFLPTKDILQKIYSDYWDNWIEPQYQSWTLLNPGYYAVTLNMAEETCMIKKGDDFDYQTRKFEIRYKENSLNQAIKVPEKEIYELCTNAGKWTRIEPIEIKMKINKTS